MKTVPDPELLALVPVQAVPFETGEDGRVTLLRPKFLHPHWAWLHRFMRRPVFRVRLDDKGAFIWLAMDGARSVGELSALARERFAEEGEPHEERCGLFVQQLVKGGFAAWKV